MESIWSQSCRIEPRNTLTKDLEADVAVIGAGLTGTLTAAMLQAEGCRVVVLEAGRIAGGQTRNTTAKITSQHGLVYRRLIQTLGQARARQYAMANEAAIAEYDNVIKAQNIDCDFEKRDAFVYGDDIDALGDEVRAAVDLGLPASLVTASSLPFPAAGAVRFSGQAQFHPLKFIKAASACLSIYEKTPVIAVEDELLTTERGRVRAKHIVFACHYPFVNFPGLYFARLHQERSYVLALKNAPQMGGMWIGAEKEHYSFRNHGDLLLLGGEGHRTGENREGGRYEKLRQRAAEWFPESQEVAHWSAQDCVTPDGVPYIGRYAASRPNWYVATGFQKWGMTSSMVAAMLLRDMICGRENPWAEVFDPARIEAEAIPGMVRDGGHAVKGLVKRLFQVPEASAAHIPPGHGGVVLLDGNKVGVYRDDTGTIHAVDIRCPHLGCQLEWNPDEKSWDCPCHGSRFDGFGNLISGPAQEGIGDA